MSIGQNGRIILSVLAAVLLAFGVYTGSFPSPKVACRRCKDDCAEYALHTGNPYSAFDMCVDIRCHTCPGAK